VQGITVHIGSQLTDLAPLEASFRRVGELIAALRGEGIEISLADLGGGLGVPYEPGTPDPPTPAAYGEMVARVTEGWNVRLAFEPGRLIVANAGVLLAKVIRVKPGERHPWVIVDAAMNDLMRPALYDAYHHIEAVRPGGERLIANVVGPVCESGDTFAMARELDRLEAGDLVAFRSAGAYGAAMSSGYNSRPLTPEVLVQGKQWALVRRRVDLADCAAMPLPKWLG
jgi:diaminopimelate decarboxylase